MFTSCSFGAFAGAGNANTGNDERKHVTKLNFPPPSNGDYNFQIICHIINSITPLGEAFNIAHLDTSFASIDPKIMNLHPIEGTYLGIGKLH